jgi:hypothetical protein
LAETWDPEAEVFVATSDDIGLATEAPTLAALQEKLPPMIQDLLEGGRGRLGAGIDIIGRDHRNLRQARLFKLLIFPN